MVAPPTLVATQLSSWVSNGSSKSASPFSVLTDDIFAAIVGVENASGPPNMGYSNSPAGVTWVEGTQLPLTSTPIYPWVQNAHGILVSASSGVATTVARSGGDPSNWWGQLTQQWRDSDGVGAQASWQTASNGGQLSGSFTTQHDNSAILYLVNDWWADNLSTRTHQSVNGYTPSAGNGLELLYAQDSNHLMACAAYIPDAGAAGAKTIGLTGTTSGPVYMTAIEIRGGAGAAGPTLAVWDGSSEQPAALTVWNGSTEDAATLELAP